MSSKSERSCTRSIRKWWRSERKSSRSGGGVKGRVQEVEEE